MGWYTPELTDAETRLQGVAVWEIISFVLNAVLFGLVGLQLPAVLDRSTATRRRELLGYAAAVSLAVTAVRFAFVFPYAGVGADDASAAAVPLHVQVAQHDADLVDGHARRRLARRRPRAAVHDGRRRAVPVPRPDRVPHVLRDPRDARAPGRSRCRA